MPKPNTWGAINTIIVFYCKDPPPCCDNTLLFSGRIRLVIVSEFLRHQLAVLLLTQKYTRITNIDPNQLISANNGHRQGCSTEFGINTEVTNNLVLHLRNSICGRPFDVSAPTGVGHHLHSQLITELSRDSITMLPVSIQDTKNESVGSGIIRHDEGILILFTGIVWSMPFLRYSRVFSDSTSKVKIVIFGRLRFFHRPLKTNWWLCRSINILAVTLHCETTTDF
mmetsp:Transcript_23139/g.35740  ORF Transcript_23139/g.35740 Transcript_23139/m.35740 type:complete len:225 (+) Transcript_23139:628-1302(+)